MLISLHRCAVGSGPAQKRFASCPPFDWNGRFKADMWSKIAEELSVPWRAAEAMHWQLGEQDMARRAGVTPFSLSSVTLDMPAKGRRASAGTSRSRREAAARSLPLPPVTESNAPPPSAFPPLAVPPPSLPPAATAPPTKIPTEAFSPATERPPEVLPRRYPFVPEDMGRAESDPRVSPTKSDESRQRIRPPDPQKIDDFSAQSSGPEP